MSLNKLLKSQKKDLLVSPRYENYLVTHKEIQVSQEIVDLVVHEIGKPERDRSNTISASSLGSCRRMQVFKFSPLKQNVALSDATHYFHDGHFRHLKWQTLLLDAGLLTDVEVSVAMPEYNLTGTIDGINQKENFGWELKGANDRSYTFVVRNGPEHKHLRQITAYMMATGIPVWSLIYENKNTNEFKEFTVELTFELMSEVKTELEEISTHVANKTLPPMLDECKKKTGAYKKCPYAKDCALQNMWPQKGIRL